MNTDLECCGWTQLWISNAQPPFKWFYEIRDGILEQLLALNLERSAAEKAAAPARTAKTSRDKANDEML
jgi:hypothetical protein